MKKIITFILMTIGIISFHSCREQEIISQQKHLEETIEESYAKNPDLTKYSDRNEFVKYDNYSRYFVYNKMNDEQKKKLWINKMEFILQNVDLNKKQKFVVEQIIKELTINGLSDLQKLTTVAQKGGFSDYEEKLYFQNLSNFDKTTKQLTPYFISHKMPDPTPGGGTGSGDCYTSWCTMCTMDNPCKAGGCVSTTTGCGWWNGEPCDAYCIYVP
ncbi:bacteriocin fulvocin C-related protein [Epilithonimonas hominis]|nr:bacteriocin fulvocin C-related protein [Epilithonimonas hominis]